jgi:hypothetical protein
MLCLARAAALREVAAVDLDRRLTVTTLLRWQNEYRLLPLLLAAALVVMVACIAGVLWSESGLMPRLHFASADAARRAFAQVAVNSATQADLARLGLDGTTAGARSLAGLGVQEYFMPKTSRQFDAMDPAIRSCFEGQDRCTALVIPFRAPGGDGLMAAHAAAPAGRMVFLLRSGRVTYKQLVED